jgi:GNAT superfamily N-acetyltransferase
LKSHSFNNEKSLIGNFDFLEPKEAASLLSSIGLSSVPTWLRPFSALSNGEQYRAELAYKIGIAKENDTILIDEYTSVVDRDVAKAMSYALQKYIRKNKKKIILASCHFDIMEWLLPDWTYSPLKGRVEKHDYLRQSRPKIELQIFRCRYDAWKIFKQHHYISEDLNKAAKCFIVIWKDKPIAFLGILPFPHGHIQNGYRISRLVVLPDFQGLGLGCVLMTYIGALYKKDNKNIYFKTSNPAVFSVMAKSLSDWKLVGEVTKNQLNSEWMLKQQTADKKGILSLRNAITKSYKYIGPESEHNTDVLTFNADAYKIVSQRQIQLF